MRRIAILIAVAVGTLAVEVGAQSLTVTSSYEPDFHFLVNDTAFFPIGWFSVISSADLRLIRENGATVVCSYWNAVCDGVGTKNKNDNSYKEYRSDLKSYLEYARRAGLKVIVDLGCNSLGKLGFTEASIAELVRQYCTHPAVFAWYLFDEPYATLVRSTCGTFPTAATLDALASMIRSTETGVLGAQRHPVIPVFADPRAFEDYNPGGTETCRGKSIPLPPPFLPSSYDAIGWDGYVFTTPMDRDEHKWNDYNNIARLITRRGLAQTVKHRKMAFLFVGQGADRAPDAPLRKPMSRDLLYQALSPLIQGARGLLFWNWSADFTSAETRRNINAVIRFIRSNRLDDVLMQGESVTPSATAQNLRIDDQAAAASEYTWKNHNNYRKAITPDQRDPGDAAFRLLNCAARRYNGVYYLFLVNDYRKKVDTEFQLGFVRPEEIVAQVQELTVQGTTTRTLDAATLASSRLPVVLKAYEAKVYRITTKRGSP